VRKKGREGERGGERDLAFRIKILAQVILDS